MMSGKERVRMTSAEIIGLHQEECRQEQQGKMLSLLYIISGEGILRAQQQEVAIGQDDLVAINPDIGYEIQTGMEPMEYSAIKVAEVTFDFSRAETDFAVLHCADCRDQMRFYLRQFFYEHREKQSGWEVASENLLGAKGFLNSIVTISNGNVDVLVNKKDLSKVERSQIEDIIVRKTGCQLDKIVITSIKTED